MLATKFSSSLQRVINRPRMTPKAAAAAAETGPPKVNPAAAMLAAGCVALLASGVVPTRDAVFSVAWPAYLAAANRWRFDSNAQLQSSRAEPLVADAWVRSYAAAAGVLSILVPAAVVAFGRLRGAPDSLLPLAGPHLYLVIAQVVCEFLTSGPRMAMLPRMLVPIGFNTWRMWALVDWVTGAVAAGEPAWHVALAAANLVFWAYNLFIFLLLNMLPRYLDPAKCAGAGEVSSGS